MSRFFVYSGQSLMQAIEVNRLADMLHDIGFRAGTMQLMLRGLMPDETPRAISYCYGNISDGQMADLDRAMIRAGHTARTAEFQLINDSAPWQEIWKAILSGKEVFSLPEPVGFVPPQLEICR